MKRIIFLLIFIFLGVGLLLYSTDQLEVPTVEIKPIPKIEPEPLFDVISINLTENDLKMYSKKDGAEHYRTIRALKSDLESTEKQLLFATNGGIFQEDLTPLGLYIENGETIKEMNRVQDAYGNFYLQPNGVFYLQDQTGGVVKTEEFDSIENVRYATQSGPMLITDGEINSLFKIDSEHFNIRSGVCFPEKNNAVFIISNRPVTFYQFAEAFLEEHCIDALYLDGAISEIYSPDHNRLNFGLEYGVIIGATNATQLPLDAPAVLC